jgi:membrane-bound serine protease (ClpP class)
VLSSSLVLAAVTATEATAEAATAAGDGSSLAIPLLLIFGVLLVLLETVVPGGLLGALAAGLFFVAVVVATRQHGGAAGIAVLAFSLVVSVVAVCVGWYFLPKTKWGQRLFLEPSFGRGRDPVTAEAKAKATIKPGDTGESVTDLRPAGVAKIGPWRVDVVTRGEYVDKGIPVEVVALDGTRIVVRARPAD